MSGKAKALLEIIKMAWAATGKRGPLTKKFIDSWRESHPDYGRWSLDTQFFSGCPSPVRGKDKLDRATAAWIASGKPKPHDPKFSRVAFEKFFAGYVDEYCEEFYK